MSMPKISLEHYAKAVQLPDEFRIGDSAIPLYWYIGLKEGDDLGIQVFKESILLLWPDYLKRIIINLQKWGAFHKEVVPFKSGDLGLKLGQERDARGYIKILVPDGQNPYLMRYWNSIGKIWAPGVNYFEKLSRVLIPRGIELFIAVLSISGIFFCRDRWVRMFTLLLFAASLAIIISSSILLGVRDKEYIALLPLISIIYAFGLSNFLIIIKRYFNNLQLLP
jgi:hypothetical protein